MDTIGKFSIICSILFLNYFMGTDSQGLCLSEHNAARAKYGRQPLQYNAELEQAAKTHSELMAESGCFSHQCPGEARVGERVTEAGYQWSGVAENIAKGQKDCKDVMKSWMNSSGHKRNILGNYQDVGCSKIESYWTCNFGTPA